MKETFLSIPVFDSSLPFSVSLAGVSYCDGSYRIKRSRSDIACVEYVISGSGTVSCGSKKFTAKAGDSYLLPTGVDHDYYSSSDDPWVKIWFNAKGTLVESLLDVYDLRDSLVYHCDTKKYINAIHETLINLELSTSEISDKCAVNFLRLIQLLAANKGEKYKKDSATLIKEYLDKNVYKQITLSELAALISKSEAHTIRLFKSKYKLTPYNYLNSLKIRKAEELLINTRYSVKEIAFMLGFSDEHYFSGFFKEKTSKSPTDFRK